MRIYHTISQDIKFQFKYGFYFIYAVMILFYIVVTGLLPEAWKSNATAIIIFMDPAGLGFFFIGGILLLERNERVLDALFVSPLEVWEYVLSKAGSLGVISVMVGIILTLIGKGFAANLPMLVLSLFAGSAFFTFAGIITGIKARTINQYMVITLPAEVVLSIPPVLLLAGVHSLFLEIMPTSLALRLIQYCTGDYQAAYPLLMLAGLALWSVPAFYLALGRMKWFLSKIGGEEYAAGN